MKAFLKFIVIALSFSFLAGMVACEDFTKSDIGEDPPLGPPASGDIFVFPPSLSFKKTGGLDSVSVVCASEWFVTSDMEWIKTETVGDVVRITIGEATMTREGYILIETFSDSKTIPISQRAPEPLGLFADALVGEWNVTGYCYNDGELLDNAHVITIAKVDATTIDIYNTFGFSELYGDGRNFAPDSEVVRATLNPVAHTISLPYQAIEPTIDPDGWPCYLFRNEYSEVADAWNNNAGNLDIPVVDFTIDFSTNILHSTSDQGEKLYTSYVILTQDPAAPDSEVFPSGGVFLNTVWTKINMDSAPGKAAGEKSGNTLVYGH